MSHDQLRPFPTPVNGFVAPRGPKQYVPLAAVSNYTHQVYSLHALEAFSFQSVAQV